jgi:hypothetical protein
MPSAPGVAQPVAGQGVLALPSVQAGPLKKMVRVPVEYVYKHWGKIEKFTMAGQFTEIEEDDFWVDPKDGKSYPYERVDNGDGTWSEWGTCYTKGGMVISNGMSTQNGLSLFGQSSGGNASTGQANLTTGVERMLNMGRCLHRTWGKQIVESTTTTQVIVSGPTKEQYENKIANLESHLNELLKHPVDKAVAPKPAAAKPATK